ncbi:MAG: hypothetical protein U5J64_09385 [Halobacteriales archaeon]|nr:hypothetical protein [Halobacteriales archaeon]
MKRHLKILIVMAFTVPIFIELRTFFGDFLGVESISLPVSIVAAIIVAVLVVLVDETVTSGGDRGGGSELVGSKD